MVTPRVTIDQLPEQAASEDTNYVIIQDAGVTKRISIGNLAAGLTTGPLQDHLADTDDAHDASAVSATLAGAGIDGPNVQAQLGQIATLIAALDARVTALENP